MCAYVCVLGSLWIRISQRFLGQVRCSLQRLEQAEVTLPQEAWSTLRALHLPS
jgi:hypothetical protein